MGKSGVLVELLHLCYTFEIKKCHKSLICSTFAFCVMYPEPGSNRHALRHWCLRPTRLPIPPSGLSECKDNAREAIGKTFQTFFCKPRSFILLFHPFKTNDSKVWFFDKIITFFLRYKSRNSYICKKRWAEQAMPRNLVIVEQKW